MFDPINAFGEKVFEKRKERHLTQKNLAAKLGMSHRTIMQTEKMQSIPHFDTVILLYQELNISLDALVFSETAAPNAVPKCVYDFFHGKTEKEAQQFIDLCKSIEVLNKGNEDKGKK